MTAQQFESWLQQMLAAPLPGVAAQRRMAPQPRPDWDPDVPPAGVVDAAVLVLLYPHRGELHFPLTVRAIGLRQHTGQVSLPGGRVDAGETLEQAALREASEEIGVRPGDVRILGRLTVLHVPVSRYLVHPFVGIAAKRPCFEAADAEVARIIEVPLSILRNPATVHREQRYVESHGHSTMLDVPFFQIGREKVWGATAMILAELVALLNGE